MGVVRRTDADRPVRQRI